MGAFTLRTGPAWTDSGSNSFYPWSASERMALRGERLISFTRLVSFTSRRVNKKINMIFDVLKFLHQSNQTSYLRRQNHD